MKNIKSFRTFENVELGTHLNMGSMSDEAKDWINQLQTPQRNLIIGSLDKKIIDRIERIAIEFELHEPRDQQFWFMRRSPRYTSVEKLLRSAEEFIGYYHFEN